MPGEEQATSPLHFIVDTAPSNEDGTTTLSEIVKFSSTDISTPEGAGKLAEAIHLALRKRLDESGQTPIGSVVVNLAPGETGVAVTIWIITGGPEQIAPIVCQAMTNIPGLYIRSEISS